jgi:hypothetical protein
MAAEAPMSMIMQYVRIQADELARLRGLLTDDPNEAFEYCDELADGDGRALDTDKTWAAMAYLLDRLGDAPVDPIHGGERLGDDDWGYEPPRYLAPDDVRRVALYLGATPFSMLVPFFDPVAMREVYPQIWDEPNVAAYVASWYADLTGFFRSAADGGDGVIAYLS